MSEISSADALQDLSDRVSELEDGTTGIIAIVVVTAAAVAGAWFITGKIIDRKVARKVKKQEKEAKKASK